MPVLVIVLTFLSMAAFAFLMWHFVQKQEQNDPGFEEKLAADDRRARANRQTMAKGGLPSPPNPHDSNPLDDGSKSTTDD